MSRKDEINQRLANIDIEKTNLYTEIKTLEESKAKLIKEKHNLEQELIIISAKNNNSSSIDYVSEKYKGYNFKYKGKANGKTETLRGDTYAECNTCKCSLELFQNQSPVGSSVIGVCPKCKCEIDFTNYGGW
jgi:hypothetical protein